MSDVPTVAGPYWLRRAVFHRNTYVWHEPYPIIVEVIQNSNDDFEDLVVAEWAGSLFPPEG
jgi:hypothetical protein